MKGGAGRQTRSQGERRVNEKAETEVMRLQAKEHHRWPANHQKLGERQGTDPSSPPSKGASPVYTMLSDFWPPELGDIYIYVKPPNCGSLWWQPSQPSVVNLGYIPPVSFAIKFKPKWCSSSSKLQRRNQNRKMKELFSALFIGNNS